MNEETWCILINCVDAGGCVGVLGPYGSYREAVEAEAKYHKLWIAPSGGNSPYSTDVQAMSREIDEPDEHDRRCM